MSKMRAFHNDPAIKAKYVERLTLHGDRHADYEKELGIPVALAFLHDRCFEGLPAENAGEFATAFLDAIPVGADLSRVAPRLMLWLLREELPQHIDAQSVRAAIASIAALYERRIAGGDVPPGEFRAAAYAAADAAAYAAARAARTAAYAAYAAADAARTAAAVCKAQFNRGKIYRGQCET